MKLCYRRCTNNAGACESNPAVQAGHFRWTIGHGTYYNKTCAQLGNMGMLQEKGSEPASRCHASDSIMSRHMTAAGVILEKRAIDGGYIPRLFIRVLTAAYDVS